MDFPYIHPNINAGTDSEDEIWEDNEENLDGDYHTIHVSDGEIPDLPVAENDSNSTQESALRTWLLLFLIRFQAKFYLPNTAMACLLMFIYTFLNIIGHHSNFVAQMLTNFPTSVYLLKQHVKSKETFVRYVVCRKCYSVYDYKNCVEKCGASLVSKK